MKVREGNIGTLFGSFGISLPQIAAQARVKVEPIIGVGKNGLPFIAETGDQIECVWAQFVRARDGSTTGLHCDAPRTRSRSRRAPNHTWTANVTNVQFTNANDDVAIRYWAREQERNAPCDFERRPKKPLPHTRRTTCRSQIDWINVYDTGGLRRPSAAEAAAVRSRRRRLCGGPGFLYTDDTTPGPTCRVGFKAEVDTGANDVEERSP